MRAVVAITLSLCAGCSEVSVTGAFGDRALRVSGTVAAWVDETEYIADTDGGAPVLSDRDTDAVLMHILFSEAVYDPRVDLRTLPAGEAEAIRADIDRGDRLLLDIRRGNVMRPGDPIALVPSDGSLPPEVLPFIEKVSISLGEPVIDESTSYPERAARIGSKLDAALDVAETSPELVGVVTVKAEKDEDEGDGFLEGRVEISFGAELLPERLAECNFAAFAQGLVNACDLE
jgi:hypothetical protein